MKLLIIEDERPSFARLASVLGKIGSALEIEGPLTSVKEVRNYFAAGNSADIIISEVRLHDGLVFSAFESVDISAHIIFTISYSDYTVNSFNATNGIQYLLKPVVPEELSAAIDKTLWTTPCRLTDVYSFAAGIRRPSIRKRFLVPWLDGFEVIPVNRIAYIVKRNNGLFLCDFDNNRYPLSTSIDECIIQLDAELFFRVSDNHIVNINAISGLTPSWGSNLTLYLNTRDQTEITVSREKALALRLWLDQSPSQS